MRGPRAALGGFCNVPYGLAATMLLAAVVFGLRGLQLRFVDPWDDRPAAPPLHQAAEKAGRQVAGSIWLYAAGGALLQSMLFACFGAIVAELRANSRAPTDLVAADLAELHRKVDSNRELAQGVAGQLRDLLHRIRAKSSPRG